MVFSKRTVLVREIIKRLDEFSLVRVNGTPASGKTTLMHLVIDHLLSGKCDKPLYMITRWDQNYIRSMGGWASFLQAETGVKRNEWRKHPCYLFLDEAQESYKDGNLWAEFFKAVDSSWACRILLLTSYGSPGSSATGITNQEMIKIPMSFGPGKQISLRPVCASHFHRLLISVTVYRVSGE
ncbi:hypothetical protein BJX63DRAFT_214533 [Aspergillus granulosus]|uniref:AAA+ ATPase domain-containing protein n=1 Tax=Aspergillus granulosus TaxID=176169 RepID=A0ABR4HE25_9EURO